MEITMLIKPERLDERTRAIYPDGVDPHNGREVGVDGIVLKAFADRKITVDKLLDNVDLKLDWYIPSDFTIEFMIFIRLVLGEEPENTSPKAHYFFIDCIFQQPNVKPFFMARGVDFDELNDRVIILASREFSKSTLVTYLFLYMAAKGKIPGFGKVNYGIYISDSMRNNVATTMDTIRKVYMESKYLKSIFEETRLVQHEVNFIRKPTTKKEIDDYHQAVNVEGLKPTEVPGRMKRTFTLVGIGAATGGRGSRDGLARPDFTVFDDMIPSEKDASSDATLDAVESTIEADILPGMNNNNNFSIMIGTPYGKKDPVYRRIEQGSWLPVVFPRGESIPSGTEEEFVSVWPDRHSYKNCKRDYKKAMLAKESGDNGPMRRLMQEHYLRISSEEDRMISDQMINWYNRSKMMSKLNQYNLYMTTDFTTTGNAGSDLSGTAMWALGAKGDWFLLDLSLRKKELTEQYSDVFSMVNTWTRYNYRGVTVGVEVDGGQRAHIQALKDRMVERNEWFTIGRQRDSKPGSEGIMSRLEGGNKHWRFRMTLPLFQNHKIWFPEELRDNPDMKELLEELEYCTYTAFGSAHDDGADLISQLLMMESIQPPISFENDDEEENKPLKKRSGMWRHSDMHYEGDGEDNGAYSSYVD
jgi:hypothetical protein